METSLKNKSQDFIDGYNLCREQAEQILVKALMAMQIVDLEANPGSWDLCGEALAVWAQLMGEK